MSRRAFLPFALVLAAIMLTGCSYTPARNTSPVAPGSHRVGNGELSPALVEILASLDAPRSAGRARNS